MRFALESVTQHRCIQACKSCARTPLTRRPRAPSTGQPLQKPSTGRALDWLTPEEQNLHSADPWSPQKFASRRRWSLAPARGLRTSLRSQHGHTSVEPPTAGRAARFKTFYSIFYYC